MPDKRHFDFDAARASPATQAEAIIWAQRAMTLALRLRDSGTLKLADGTSLRLDSPTLRETLCKQSIHFMTELALEEARVPAALMLERLKVYLDASDGHSCEFFVNAEAVNFVCFVCLAYETAAAAFVERFPDDEEVLVELAMAAEAVSSLLRYLNNGEYPLLVGSPLPRLTVLVESLRRRPGAGPAAWTEGG